MAGKNYVSVQIEGWEELERKLRGLGKHINEQELLEGALMDGAYVIKDEIEAQAPYLTGQLSENIEISKKGREKYSVRIGPSGKGFYGRFQEYGTSHHPAQPFMRPAFDFAIDEAQEAISDAIWHAIQEAAEKR